MGEIHTTTVDKNLLWRRRVLRSLSNLYFDVRLSGDVGTMPVKLRDDVKGVLFFLSYGGMPSKKFVQGLYKSLKHLK